MRQTDAAKERDEAKQQAEDMLVGRALMLMMCALVIFAATMAFVTHRADHAKPAWHESSAPLAEVSR